MNPPSDLARAAHAVLARSRGLTLAQLADRMGKTVTEVYPAVRWLLRHGFIANRSLSRPFNQREAVYVRVKGKELPPAPAKPARVRVRTQDSYGKPPVGWDAADDLQKCMGGWKPNDYLAEQ